mgnify:CR=1 FL=1
MKNVTLKVSYPHHECDPDFFVFTLPDDTDVRDFTVIATSVLSAPASEDDEINDFLDVLDERLDEICSHFSGAVSAMMIDYIPVDANF